MKPPSRYYPPEMLVSLAAEREDPYTIAAVYGYPASEFDKIRNTPTFKVALEKAKESLQATGLSADVAGYSMLQEFSMRIAEDLFVQYHSPLTPIDSKVKIASTLFSRENQLRERVMPKDKQVQGNGVQIVINIPDAAKEVVTLDAA